MALNHDSEFVWTATGGRIHVTVDDPARAGRPFRRTRCGQRVAYVATADEVVWFWPPCARCTKGLL